MGRLAYTTAHPHSSVDLIDIRWISSAPCRGVQCETCKTDIEHRLKQHQKSKLLTVIEMPRSADSRLHHSRSRRSSSP